MELILPLNVPIVRCCSRFWRFYFLPLLQSWDVVLAFGACRPAFCSICEMLFSLLEGVDLRFAPFVRCCSRNWSCLPCFSLHSRASSLAFGGLFVSFPSNRESIVSLLEGLLLRIAPFVRLFSRVCRLISQVIFCCKFGFTFIWFEILLI